VSRGYLPQLVVLSALWGVSYLFIKVGVEELAPAVVLAARSLLAGAVLWAVLVWKVGARRALADVRATGRRAVVLGVITSVIPFWLIAWSEQHIDAGIAAVANSTVPLFVALLAIRFRPSERAGGLRLVGILIGLVGVGVLAGFHPQGGSLAVAGTLCVVLASLCVAASFLYTQEHFPTTQSLVLATAAVTSSALVILPFGLVQLPDTFPSAKVAGSMVALGVVGTAVAYLIFYRLLALYGSARTSLVTYLLPVFALLFGALLLDERLSLNAILGLGLILSGVTLGSGWVLMRSSGAPTV
jgi:drug/metabolite transporter (DMT)-like permease